MNKEKYSDPTAEIAIARVMREEKRKRKQSIIKYAPKEGKEDANNTRNKKVH